MGGWGVQLSSAAGKLSVYATERVPELAHYGRTGIFYLCHGTSASAPL